MASQTCALCAAPAVLFCINDDAALCTSCDATIHAGNPLLARHERRPLAAACHHTESASEARPAVSDDVAVVPQFGAALTPTAPVTAVLAAQDEPAAAALLAPALVPCGAGLDDGLDFAADLLDLDLPLLDFDFKELCREDFADCVVPGPSCSLLEPPPPAAGATSSGSALASATSTYTACTSGGFGGGFHSSAAAGPLALGDTFMHTAPHQVPAALQPHAHSSMVPMAAAPAYPTYPAAYQPYSSSPFAAAAGGVVPQQLSHAAAYRPGAAAAPAPRRYASAPARHHPRGSLLGLDQQGEEDEAQLAREVERLRRLRAAKRASAKRTLGRAVRYQSRKAYAMVRPRIKGRFVR